MMAYDVVMTPSDDGHWVLKSEADREIRHQKYKRCLGLATICECRTAYTFGRRLNHNLMWRERWLKLAEKFKDKEA